MSWNMTEQMGNLTTDIKVNEMSNGNPYANFTLAVQRNFKNKDGERETDFHPCVIFGNGAKVLSKYTGKGKRVLVYGSLQNNSKKDKETGKWQDRYSIIVSQFRIIDYLNNDNQSSKPKHDFSGTPDKKKDPFKKQSTGVHVGEDDVPF